MISLDTTLKEQATEAKINTVDHIKLKSFCITKDNQQNDKTTYKMEEDTCKLYIWEGVNVIYRTHASE